MVPGILNFRAVAPFAAAGGRLKPQALFRCGAFDGIAPEGRAALRAAGVRTVFDLRSEQEKGRAPSPLLQYPEFRVRSHAHSIRSGDLAALLEDPCATPEQCRAEMARIYAQMPLVFVDVFALLFRTAATDGAPLAIHCTAGKDRTGIAVALILDLLGVNRADIMEDYLQSNDARDALHAMLYMRTRAAGLGRVMPHLVTTMTTCRPEYLEGMFATVRASHGSTRAYATAALGLTPQMLDDIAAHLVA